jgi:curved DNA-binding protein CbpA
MSSKKHSNKHSDLSDDSFNLSDDEKSTCDDNGQVPLLDYYEVLGLSKNATQIEIRKQYKQLAIKYHPDRGGDEALFTLIQRAYDNLCNEAKKDSYDKMMALEKKSRRNAHHRKKKAFEEFLEAQNNDVSDKGKDHAKLEFEKNMSDYDRKHKFDRTKMKEEKDNPLSTDDYAKRIRDLELTREQDEIEFTQKRLFQQGRFDTATFNAMFDAMHGNEEKEMVKYNGAPGAWNDATNNFTSINTKYEDMYEEGDFDGNDKFSSLSKLDSKKKKISDDQLKNIKPATYVKNHNVKESDYDELMKRKLKEREQETNLYTKKDYDEYDTNVEMGGYGFMHEIGYTGKDAAWENNDDNLNDAYNKLLKLRKSNTETN